MSSSPVTQSPQGALTRLVSRLVLVRPGEGRALLFAGGYFFFLLFSFYLLRPVREAMGIARGADKLPWLMTGTMVAMFLAYPLHALAVSKLSRRKFIPRISHFFASHLLLFFALFQFLPEHGGGSLGYAFYIWLSVFNLFVVSVFWAFMADVFDEDQGKRLFGVISMGGTLGAILGAAATDALTRGTLGLSVEPSGLLLISLVVLELSVLCMLKLADTQQVPSEGGGAREPGPKLAEGLRLIASSRYLQLICLYIFLFTITSTVLYLVQGQIVEKSFEGAAARTAAFARIDLWTNVLTLLTQAFLTARLVRSIGVAGVLLVLPVITLAGFGALVAWPVFGVLAVVMVLRRGLHYAVDRPAREILYIRLGPEEKYKSKPFIDTFIYRVGDFIGVWTPAMLGLAAIPVGAASLALSAGWLGSGLWLGKMVRKFSSAK